MDFLNLMAVMLQRGNTASDALRYGTRERSSMSFYGDRHCH